MAKKSFANRRKLVVPIYDCILWVIVSQTVKDGALLLPPALKSAYTPDEDDNCKAIFYYDSGVGKNYAIIFTLNAADGPVIHHETGHAARTILKDIEWRIDFDNDEPLAYLEEWINREVTKACVSITSPKKPDTVTLKNSPLT